MNVPRFTCLRADEFWITIADVLKPGHHDMPFCVLDTRWHAIRALSIGARGVTQWTRVDECPWPE